MLGHSACHPTAKWKQYCSHRRLHKLIQKWGILSYFSYKALRHYNDCLAFLIYLATEAEFEQMPECFRIR